MDHEKLDQAELSIEAALRGVAQVREGGSTETCVANLYRAIHEIQDAAPRVADVGDELRVRASLRA